MDNNLKILFISAPIGSGHIRAAQSIQQAIHKLHPDADTKLVNVFDFFNPQLGRWILNIYLKILKIFPKAYGMAYSWGNSSRIALCGRELVSRYLAGRMELYIRNYKPSAIVCTHATPAGLVANLLQRGLIQIPVIGVVTDFTVHRLWVYPEIQHYYVAHEGMRHFLSGHGIPLKRSSVSGIPVMPQFNYKPDKVSIRNKLGLCPTSPTLLVMGGGAGIMPLDLIVQSCCELEDPIQLIVVAGHNQTMYNRLTRLKTTANKTIHIYSYTDNVHELMGAADLLISKPGGVSSAEALALGLPMVIYEPIPGVEEANTDFLTRTGTAVRADHLEQVKELILILLHDNKSRETMQRLAYDNGEPEAAACIANGILNMTNHR